MNNNFSLIEKQIGDCKKLLRLFQQERQLYIDKCEIPIKDVLNILKRKMGLVQNLEDMRRFLTQSGHDKTKRSHKPENNRQARIRELGELLEQLLVIEHENELLLKKIIKRPLTQSNSPNESHPSQANLSPNGSVHSHSENSTTPKNSIRKRFMTYA